MPQIIGWAREISCIEQSENAGTPPRQESVFEIGPDRLGTVELVLTVAAHSVRSSNLVQIALLQMAGCDLPAMEPQHEYLLSQYRQIILHVHRKSLNERVAIGRGRQILSRPGYLLCSPIIRSLIVDPACRTPEVVSRIQMDLASE